MCKKKGIQGLVALGGGSTMDCTKVIAAAALAEDDPWEYLWGHKKTFPASLPTVMIPTMAATGTEINPWAVIMDEETTWKSACTAECMYPDVTIQDPEIILTLPIRLTIWGAMDILSHTFEFYFNGNRESIFQTRFSEATIHSVMEAVDLLVKDPNDIRARGELQWSSVMAWGGLNFIGRGGPDMACHTIAEGFVPYFDIHHGASLGVITPRWMRFAAPKAPVHFARFAGEFFGLSDVKIGGVVDLAKRGVEAYIDWLKKIGAPNTLQELTGEEVSKEKLKEIVARTFADAGGKVGVLVEMSREEAVELLLDCQKPL
jgi:alcohol dehydrogenase